jgi:hypothetical protein
MDTFKRIQVLNDLKPGDVIRLHEDLDDGFPEIDVVFVDYINGDDILTVETEADGVFEVDGAQFKQVIRRVP